MLASGVNAGCWHWVLALVLALGIGIGRVRTGMTGSTSVSLSAWLFHLSFNINLYRFNGNLHPLDIRKIAEAIYQLAQAIAGFQSK
ncbi:MAG: hypothetical protein ACFB16_14150 [Phormidesmis sp.]